MTFGLDVTPISKSEIELMDIAHVQNAKSIQNLPVNTPTASCLCPLGWITLYSHIAILKLNFMFRTLSMHVDSIYKRVMLHVLDKFTEDGFKSKGMSPIENSIEFMNRVGLHNALFDSLKSREFLNSSEYKTMIKTHIRKHEFSCLKATCLLSKSLNVILYSVNNLKIHMWWNFANKCPNILREISAVVAVMCGTQPKRLGHFCKQCNLCNHRLPNSSEHILFECEILSDVRETQLVNLYYVMPIAMKTQFELMPNYDKMCFLVSGLNCGYVEEWSCIYTNIAKFVFKMYSKRKTILDSRL